LAGILGWFGSEKGKGAGFSLMSLGNMLTAFFTYLRFAEIARIFGTSWQTDAVAVAFVIPLLLQQLISTAFGSAFLPIYSRVRRNKGVEASNLLVNRIVNWMVITGILFLGTAFLFGRGIVGIVGPGADAETLDLAAVLLRIFLPLVFLNAVEGILQNFLIYHNRYGLVSFLKVLQILASYIFLLAGHGRFGIIIVPLSGLAGAAVSFLACAAFSIRLELRPGTVLDPRDGDFRELVRLAVPVMVGVVTGFLGPVADKILASFLAESSITAIDYAARIRNLVRMVMIEPLIVLCTVYFSKAAAAGGRDLLRKEIPSYMRNLSYYTIPAAAILTVFAVPLVSVFFQRGHFGPGQSRLVGHVLSYYAPWLAQFGMGVIAGRAFYALKETITPIALGIWGMICNILLNVILVGSMGVGGLALATTVTSSAKTLMLLITLRRRLGGIGGKEFVPEYLRFLLAGGIMSGFLLLAGSMFPVDLESSLWSRLSRLALIILPGLGIYVAVTAAAGSRTFRDYYGVVRSGLSRGGS